MRRQYLLLALIVALAFAAGFCFDRSLHRPIEIHLSQAEPGDSGMIGRPDADVSCGLPWNACWKTA
ncbi:MAG TPA: hypothetical protein VGU20_31175 [Stellaceae bacterium]|nr:hypothetical protein [Terriglobia bacterium]HEV2551814.1 hypothetical protein [Stellaceae bacterium]